MVVLFIVQRSSFRYQVFLGCSGRSLKTSQALLLLFPPWATVARASSHFLCQPAAMLCGGRRVHFNGQFDAGRNAQWDQALSWTRAKLDGNQRAVAE